MTDDAGRLTQLVSRHLDGYLTDEERRELTEIVQRSPEAREELADALIFHGALIRRASSERSKPADIDGLLQTIQEREAASSDALPTRPDAVPEIEAGRRHAPLRVIFRKAWPILGVAAALLIAVLLFRGKDPAIPIVRIAAVQELQEGTAFVEREGNRSTELRAGSSLAAGDVVRTDERGRLEIQWSKVPRGSVSGKTVVQLGPETRARLDGRSEGAERIHLFRGAALCEFAKRQSDETMVVTTPHARIEILGTRFKVDTDRATTTLKVIRGKVRISEEASGRVAVVTSGYSAVARREAPLEAKDPARAKVGTTLPTEPITEYLDVVREFLDTLIAEGTDRYGEEHSPMFSSILDLKTRRLPDSPPPLVPGWRDRDRAFPGGNLQQDLTTLVLMDHFSAYAGTKRYAAATDAYLSFFLRRCAPAGNGLFPWGENAFWDFRKETIGRPVHQELGFVPLAFLERLRSINAKAVDRHLEALRLHIVDPKAWKWNQNAAIQGTGTAVVNSIPRHGGFYLYQWAWLHAKTGRTEPLQWAEKTAQLHWSQRHPVTGCIPTHVIGDPNRAEDDDKVLTSTMQHLSLGLALLHAGQVLGDKAPPLFDRMGRTYLDLAIDAAPHKPGGGVIVANLHADGTPALETQYPVRARFWGGTPMMRGGYGFQGAEKFAILCLSAHRMTGSRKHLAVARGVCDYYRMQPIPERVGLTPGKFAGLIALALDLHDLTGEEAYLEYAGRVAKTSVERLHVNGLFRAATGADHYEAATGAGALALELFRLHLVSSGSRYPLPRNYWDM